MWKSTSDERGADMDELLFKLFENLYGFKAHNYLVDCREDGRDMHQSFQMAAGGLDKVEAAKYLCDELTKLGQIPMAIFYVPGEFTRQELADLLGNPTKAHGIELLYVSKVAYDEARAAHEANH